MALDDKQTRLHQMLSGRSGPAPAPVGKATEVDPHGAPDAAAADGGEQAAVAAPEGKKEGGDGAAAPAPAAVAPTTGKGGAAGKITVTSTSGSKGATESMPKLGVGEQVTFSATEDGAWTIDQAEVGSGQSIEWTAPDVAALRNVVFEPNLTSTNKNARASVPVFVLAPSKVDFKKVGDVPATGPGLAGVGMTLQVTVSPDTVSFGNAEWLERPGPAENVSGYFAAYVASGQSLAHPPNPNWLPMGADNKGIMDNAWTRDKPKLKHADGTTRWWAGEFQWTIPNVYRVKGGAAHTITNVVQRFVMDDAGAITVTKGSASATARPDNQMDGEIQKFTNATDAMTFLQPHGRAGCVQAVMNYARNPKADPPSVQLLLAALRKVDVMLFVAVTCKNTFAWTDPDTVVLSANGKAAEDGGKRKINTGKTGEFEFHVNNILDMTKLGTDPIAIAANVSDMTSEHPHSASLAYPYLAKDVVMAGSDRYTFSAGFR